MKLLRTSAPLLAFITIALLAACGGGGGGGSVTPPGGGGGGTPPPTSTPTPGQTATPSPSPSPTISSTSVPVDTGFALSAQIGPQVNGDQSWYTAGVTASWTNQAGDTTSGANATNAFPTMDGMQCTPTIEPAASQLTYAVHSFVGIYYNGKELAIPSAIGMNTPVEPTKPTPNAPNGHPNDNYEVESWACEYNVHTHDYSGLVHIEDANAPQSTATTSPLKYSPSLQSLLDIWGVQLTPNGLTVPGGTNLTGPVTIYYGTPSPTDKGPHGDPVTDSYVQASVASAVPLAYHDTIWIVVGNIPTPPNGVVGLPEVEWRVQY